MTAFGDLRIAASAAADGIGSTDSEPVVYHWPWYWHLPSLGPWLLLILACALFRANRQRDALLIFVPLLILDLLWGRVTTLTGMSSSLQVQFSFVGEFLAAGIALLWLHAERLGRSGGLVRFAASLGLLGLADLAVLVSYWGALPNQSVVFTAIVTLSLLVSLTLTRRLSHRHYQPARFLLWLALWSALCSITGAAAFVAVEALAAVSPLHAWLAMLVQTILAGLVLALCLYAVNLPYLLLMFTSPFFRRRFLVWLGATVES